MSRSNVLIIVLNLLFITICSSQDIAQFNQFNGHYNYTAIGNTLNIAENNINQGFCDILPSSNADLTLPPTTTAILAAYLYWAGSGTGDQSVTLNNYEIIADETYLVNYEDTQNGTLSYFSCYADITRFVQSEGVTTYTLEDLDLSQTLANNPGYCANRTNFAGWSMYVIYEDSRLPLNQINLFQGLEIINRNVQEKTIILDNINVFDNEGAKLGFLAWEGDANLSLGETLSINGNQIQNPPLNPSNNAFNGTNSFTFSNEFYNCDLDVYNIQNNIQIGDTSAEIRLTTQADLIIINNIITVLNSQLPDATIAIDNVIIECGSRFVEIDYTVYNTNSTDLLPANTPIAFYAAGELIATSETQNDLQINESESASIIITIPTNIPDNFVLTIVVDDDGTGNGIVIELNEDNNSTTTDINLLPLDPPIQLSPLLECDRGLNSSIFDLTAQLELITYDTIYTPTFYESLDDLQLEQNEIILPEQFENTLMPQEIFIKIDNGVCFDVYVFELYVENCPPFIPQVFTPNNDGFNDYFNIQGLYDVFEQHELLIYNRYGTLIFKGDNLKKWDGKANQGLTNVGKVLPVGTYFYVLNLKDPNFKIQTGWVYLTK